jgi:hypothetical protein
MRVGTQSWPMRTPTCRSRVAESLSRLQCITLCDSTAETECTPDICRVIPLPTVASACQSNTRLRFLMLCRLGLPLLFLAGRQSIATTPVNPNQVFSAVHVSGRSWGRASLLRLSQCGGGKLISRALTTALWAVFCDKTRKASNEMTGHRSVATGPFPA